ncbi:hypothetical protein FRX31_014746 [Thalictrum thalictroides]|uniref:Uncharacterized protein n=1 Tax=Thalictrum thalictroides TaxID=46969 RepID=A0A7J6WFN2_THATH|nr:hypothetical protein FRX31_014746 [Thalictrum thalictroides]
MYSPTSSMAPEASASQRRQSRFKDLDYECILSWLETPENFNSLYGAGKRTKVDGVVRSKSVMLANLANCVNENSQGRLTLTGSQMYHRLRQYKNLFVKATDFQKKTGSGLTDEDRQKGIFSISQKLNTICPFFERMDLLFGNKPNINPLVIDSSNWLEEIIDIGTAIGAVVDTEGGGGREEVGSRVEDTEENLELEEDLEEELEDELVEDSEEEVVEELGRGDEEEVEQGAVTPDQATVRPRQNRRRLSIALEEGLASGSATQKRRRLNGNASTDLVESVTMERINWDREKVRSMEENAERSRKKDLETTKALALFNAELHLKQMEAEAQIKDRQMEAAAQNKLREITERTKADSEQKLLKGRIDIITNLVSQGASVEVINDRLKILYYNV